MLDRTVKFLLAIILLVFGCAMLRTLFSINSVEAQSPRVQSLKDNDELKRLCAEVNQTERLPRESPLIGPSLTRVTKGGSGG